MSLLLRIQASASRAFRLVTRAGSSARRETAQRSDFYRRLWREAADQIGANVTCERGDLLLITRNDATAKVYQNYTDLDGPATLRAAGNKPLVHERLRTQGIPTPEFLTFTISGLRTAENFLRTHELCVVKPASGTGAGNGVTTGIRTLKQLRRAAIRAAGYCPELLIERQVPGRNVRLLYLDGVLLDAVERRPPSVVGDGRSTIAQLVRTANRRRRELGTRAAQVFLRHDLDMKQTLAEQHLAWNQVPPSGQHVRLKTVVNDNAAEDNVSVIAELSTELIEVGRRAARTLGIRLAGVDIVTSDLGVHLAESRGVVLELNTVPGLYIHQTIFVAGPILEACLDQARQIYRTPLASMAR